MQAVVKFEAGGRDLSGKVDVDFGAAGFVMFRCADPGALYRAVAGGPWGGGGATSFATPAEVEVVQEGVRRFRLRCAAAAFGVAFEGRVDSIDTARTLIGVSSSLQGARAALTFAGAGVGGAPLLSFAFLVKREAVATPALAVSYTRGLLGGRVEVGVTAGAGGEKRGEFAVRCVENTEAAQAALEAVYLALGGDLGGEETPAGHPWATRTSWAAGGGLVDLAAVGLAEGGELTVTTPRGALKLSGNPSARPQKVVVVEDAGVLLARGGAKEALLAGLAGSFVFAL